MRLPPFLSAMKFTTDSSEKARERYATWERSAGSKSAILVVVFFASLYIRTPSALFVAGNVLSGVMVFFAWRAGMKQQSALTLLLALVAFVSALVALSVEVQQPVQVLLSQGFSLLAATLFACILAARRGAASDGPEA